MISKGEKTLFIFLLFFFLTLIHVFRKWVKKVSRSLSELYSFFFAANIEQAYHIRFLRFRLHLSFSYHLFTRFEMRLSLTHFLVVPTNFPSILFHCSLVSMKRSRTVFSLLLFLPSSWSWDLDKKRMHRIPGCSSWYTFLFLFLVFSLISASQSNPFLSKHCTQK